MEYGVDATMQDSGFPSHRGGPTRSFVPIQEALAPLSIVNAIAWAPREFVISKQDGAYAKGL